VVARESLGLPACARRVGPMDAAASLQVGGSEPVQWVVMYLVPLGRRGVVDGTVRSSQSSVLCVLDGPGRAFGRTLPTC
jgi:hypothetical protein